MTIDADLEIRLEGYDAPNQYRCRGRLRLPDSDVPLEVPSGDQELLAEIDLDAFRDLGEHEYGQKLAACLFAPAPIRDLFVTGRTWASSQDPPRPLRLRLHVGPGAQELHALHWELLHDPRRPGRLLAMDETILFSRYLPSGDPGPVPRRSVAGMKALVVVASPSNLEGYQDETGQRLAAVDVPGELKRAREGLYPIPVTALHSDEGLKPAGRPTLDELARHLRDGYEVLYLAAHGTFSKEGVPLLFLEDGKRQADVVAADDSESPFGETVPGLASQLSQLPRLPRLAVLASCESAGAGDEAASRDTRALAALGPRLVEAGVPAVMAMQGRVTMQTVARFMPVFFEELRRDGSIDRAVAAARRAVRKRPDWWVPVLYTRLESGRLFVPDVVPEATVPVIPTPFNLPAAPADFTGRQSEIDRVREALSREGTVAISGIHGMGGIGKTALALRVAHQLAAEGRFQHAQLYLDLKGSDPVPIDPAAALQALLSALLGPDPQRPTDVDALADLWRRAIHGKDAVLILDNAAGAGQVRPLLPGCASCAVLVTSRRRFALPGAGRLDLDPMDPADARALLQRLAPGLDGEGAEAIAKLCGHLPLALRVAGNYLALNDDVSPDQYATLLAGERERLARLRDPDDPDLDVEATITLSVGQLAGETRRCWALLALLRAPFDLGAAAALWEQPEESAALERLQALRNRSLVSYDDATSRYQQHDLLRLAAGRELVGLMESEIPAARDRLAHHYLAVAREVRDSQRYLDLDPDWPHLRAALEHAASASDVDLLSDLVIALSAYWSARGLARDEITWCQRAAEACAAAGRRRNEGALRGNLGEAYYYLGELLPDGDCPGAIGYYEQALAIAREVGDRRSEGVWLVNLGRAYARLGETRRAIEYHEQALAIAQEMGDRRAEGPILGNLGLAYAALGEVRKAIEYHEQVLAIARKFGDRRTEGSTLANLGQAYHRLGELLPDGDRPSAIGYYERALASVREIGDRRYEGFCLSGLGTAYEALGNVRKAIKYYEQALAIFESIEHPNAATIRRLLAELEEEGTP